MTLSDEDKRWMSEQLEKLETRLLTEFHKYAEFSDARARSHGATLYSLELQIEALRDRLEKLERGH